MHVDATKQQPWITVQEIQTHIHKANNGPIYESE